MKNNEAERAICREFESWISTNVPATDRPNARHGLSFFHYLQTARQDLLEFSASGDKWQFVHAWLQRHNLVED